jgi:hypothetical protein
MLRYDYREKGMKIETDLVRVGITPFGLSLMNGANRLLVPYNVELFYKGNINWPFGKEQDTQFADSVLVLKNILYD